MLRYKTKTRPGLLTLYNIWPGNRAGPFLQPRSPHGAHSPHAMITGFHPYVQLLFLVIILHSLNQITLQRF